MPDSSSLRTMGALCGDHVDPLAVDGQEVGGLVTAGFGVFRLDLRLVLAVPVGELAVDWAAKTLDRPELLVALEVVLSDLQLFRVLAASSCDQVHHVLLGVDDEDVAEAPLP